jgi:hypothetical protein
LVLIRGGNPMWLRAFIVQDSVRGDHDAPAPGKRQPTMMCTLRFLKVPVEKLPVEESRGGNYRTMRYNTDRAHVHHLGNNA